MFKKRIIRPGMLAIFFDVSRSCGRSKVGTGLNFLSSEERGHRNVKNENHRTWLFKLLKNFPPDMAVWRTTTFVVIILVVFFGIVKSACLFDGGSHLVAFFAQGFY